MHYKNGREAKNGDKVVVLPIAAWGAPYLGILYDAVAGNDHCNGRIAICSGNDHMPDLKNCLHVDDVRAASERIGDSTAPTQVINPPTFRDRVVAEKQELDERRVRLTAFIVGDVYKALDTNEQLRLMAQADAMTRYSNVLEERIGHFS